MQCIYVYVQITFHKQLSGKKIRYREKETLIKDALHVKIVWKHNANPY